MASLPEVERILRDISNNHNEDVLSTLHNELNDVTARIRSEDNSSVIGLFRRKVTPKLLCLFATGNMAMLSRRWVGLLLYELLKKYEAKSLMVDEAHALRSLGPMLLTATEDVKLVCGLVIRTLMGTSKMSFEGFWPESETQLGRLSEFPVQANQNWMSDFHLFIDRFAKLGRVTESSEIFYSTIVKLPGTMQLQSKEGPISIIMRSGICVAQLLTTTQCVQFIDLRPEHIRAVEGRVSKLQDQHNQRIKCYEVAISLTTNTSNCSINGRGQVAKSAHFIFRNIKEYNHILSILQEPHATPQGPKMSGSQTLDLSTGTADTSMQTLRPVEDLLIPESMVPAPPAMEVLKIIGFDAFAYEKDALLSTEPDRNGSVSKPVEETDDNTISAMKVVKAMSQTPIKSSPSLSLVEVQENALEGGQQITNTSKSASSSRDQKELRGNKTSRKQAEPVASTSTHFKHSSGHFQNAMAMPSSGSKIRHQLRSENDVPASPKSSSVHKNNTLSAMAATLPTKRLALAAKRAEKKSIGNGEDYSVWDVPVDLNDKSVKMNVPKLAKKRPRKQNSTVDSTSQTAKKRKTEQDSRKSQTLFELTSQSHHEHQSATSIIKDDTEKNTREIKRVSPRLQKNKIKATIQAEPAPSRPNVKILSHHSTVKRPGEPTLTLPEISNQVSANAKDTGEPDVSNIHTEQVKQGRSQSNPIDVSSQESESSLSDEDDPMLISGRGTLPFIAAESEAGQHTAGPSQPTQNDTQTSLVVDPALAKKPTIVVFGHNGPRNQGGSMTEAIPSSRNLLTDNKGERMATKAPLQPQTYHNSNTVFGDSLPRAKAVQAMEEPELSGGTRLYQLSGSQTHTGMIGWNNIHTVSEQPILSHAQDDTGKSQERIKRNSEPMGLPSTPERSDKSMQTECAFEEEGLAPLWSSSASSGKMNAEAGARDADQNDGTQRTRLQRPIIQTRALGKNHELTSQELLDPIPLKESSVREFKEQSDVFQDVSNVSYDPRRKENQEIQARSISGSQRDNLSVHTRPDPAEEMPMPQRSRHSLRESNQDLVAAFVGPSRRRSSVQIDRLGSPRVLGIQKHEETDAHIDQNYSYEYLAKRKHCLQGSQMRIKRTLSSNHKIKPASPQQESQAITETADSEDVEKRVVDVSRNSSNPFVHISRPKTKSAKVWSDLKAAYATDYDCGTPSIVTRGASKHTTAAPLDKCPDTSSSVPSLHSDFGSLRGQRTLSEQQREWEDSLEPHHRTVAETLHFITTRIVRHFIDSESAIGDMVDAYGDDGRHLIKNMMNSQSQNIQEYDLVDKGAARLCEEYRRRLEQQTSPDHTSLKNNNEDTTDVLMAAAIRFEELQNGLSDREHSITLGARDNGHAGFKS